MQLYYFNARWYDPETGGFITEDPMKGGLLWYSYCSNNPLKFVDPDGLEYININRYGNQQEAKGHLPGGDSIKLKGCYTQTATNIVNTFREMSDLSPLSTDVVNNYAKKLDGAYTADVGLSSTGLSKIVEHLSGFKLELEDQAYGEDDILESASEKDIATVDSSNINRESIPDFRDDEELNRLDTYSYRYTGNFGQYFREKDNQDDEDDEEERPSRRRRK